MQVENFFFFFFVLIIRNIHYWTCLINILHSKLLIMKLPCLLNQDFSHLFYFSCWLCRNSIIFPFVLYFIYLYIASFFSFQHCYMFENSVFYFYFLFNKKKILPWKQITQKRFFIFASLHFFHYVNYYYRNYFSNKFHDSAF